MPKSLSGDLHERVIEAVEAGASRREAAERFEISPRPDRTLDELVPAMHKRRIPGSRSALWRFLDRHGITFKKPAGSRAAPS